MTKPLFRRALGILLCLAFVPCGALAAETDPLFAVTLPTPEGKPLRLAQYRGQPLLVNFWARWCAPCRAEIPELLAMQAAYGRRGLRLVGIGIEDNGESVKEFLRAYDVDYPVVLGSEQGIELMQALGNGVAALPFTLVIDRRGVIVLRQLGAFKKKDFEHVARQVLE